MKGLTAIASVGLLIGSAMAFAQTSSGAASGAATHGVVTSELPDELYALAFDLTMARSLAQGCGSGVVVNDGLTDIIIQEAARDLSVKGYTSADIQRVRETLPEARVAADREFYYRKNAITETDPESFCVAARREAAEQSGIGRFLAVEG